MPSWATIIYNLKKRRSPIPVNAYVRARIDPLIKNEAAAVLAKMGLTVSNLCRMALTMVANEKRLPFNDETPNALMRKQ